MAIIYNLRFTSSSSRTTTTRGQSIRNQVPRGPDHDRTTADGADEGSPSIPHSSQPLIQRTEGIHRSSYFPYLQRYTESGSNDHRDDERDHIIQCLRAELESSKRNFEYESRKQLETYRVYNKNQLKNFDNLQRKSEADQEQYRQVCKERDRLQNQLNADSIHFERVCRENQERQHRDYNTLKELYDGLSKSYDESQALVESQKLNIRELTATISNSVNISGATTRDDDYFEAEFAFLAGAVHQWVFRCFRNVSSISYKDLPPTLLDSFRKSVFQYNDLPDSAIRSKEIEAIISERLYCHIFSPSFLLTVQEGFHDLEYICNSLSGTDLAKREWHANTVAMFFANDGYEDNLRNNTRFVEDELLGCSGVLSKGGNEEQRRKTLSTIVERAARLYKETFQQISPFRLWPITPGQSYDPTIMEDISGSVDGDNTYVVQMVHSPPVLRWGFDDDGKFLQAPIVVRKGAVIAMISGN